MTMYDHCCVINILHLQLLVTSPSIPEMRQVCQVEGYYLFTKGQFPEEHRNCDYKQTLQPGQLLCLCIIHHLCGFYIAMKEEIVPRGKLRIPCKLWYYRSCRGAKRMNTCWGKYRLWHMIFFKQEWNIQHIHFEVSILLHKVAHFINTFHLQPQCQWCWSYRNWP